MKNLLIIFALVYASLQTVMAADITTSKENNGINSPEKIVIPVFYKDYKWDVGVTGGLIFDGVQTDIKRTSIGAGLHVGYHLNESVGFHGEISRYFADLSNDEDGKKIRNTLYAVSATYDFSADRTYSLYATAGLGYEQLEKLDQEMNNPVSLLGFGFRYMLTDSLSARVEGRWKFVLVDTDTPDNSLVGTIGLDYHFGLSDEKSKLIEDAERQNKLN